MLVRSMTMKRPSVEIDSSFSAQIRRSIENCVMFNPASRKKSSYMRETARVALRRSKHAHLISNSLAFLAFLAFIRHPAFFGQAPYRPARAPAGGSQIRDYTLTSYEWLSVL